jgi:RimJ/RimL family protein N-acetyltransferase
MKETILVGVSEEQSTDPLDAVAWPWRTERLVLRRATLADSDALWEHRSLPAVSEWLGWIPRDRADWDAEYPRRLAINLAIELEGRVVGDLMIRLGDGWGQREVADAARGVEAELGWTLHPDVQGHGYASEAVRAAFDICFGPLGLRRVTAGAFARNEASWRLMERVGMRREAYAVKESLHGTHGWLDGVTYALLAEEWPRPTSPRA